MGSDVNKLCYILKQKLVSVKKPLLERFVLRASKATNMYIFILNPIIGP
jgi:hypothetical protein